MSRTVRTGCRSDRTGVSSPRMYRRSLGGVTALCNLGRRRSCLGIKSEVPKPKSSLVFII